MHLCAKTGHAILRVRSFLESSPSLCFETRRVWSLVTGLASTSDPLWINSARYVSVCHPDWTRLLCVRSPPRLVSGNLTDACALSAATDRTRWSCLGQCPVTHSDTFSPPFLHQVDPHQLQLLLLCKCANTTKCTPPCVCVLAFHKYFLED